MNRSAEAEWAGPSWRPRNLLRNTETARLLQVVSNLHYRALAVQVQGLPRAGRLERAQQRLARLYERARRERLRDHALFLFCVGEIVGLTRLILEADAAARRRLQDEVPSVSSDL